MASSHIQDGKWSWLVCLSATMSWFAAMGIVFSFGIFFPVFMDYFQESRQKTAWVGSLAIALIFFSGHLSGALVKRFGCRFTTLLGGFLCTLSLGLSSLAQNILHLYLTYSVLFGVGTGFVFSASLVIISKYFKVRRSLALGIVMLGQGGGVLIWSPLLQKMVDELGWRTTYRILCGVVPVLFAFGLTYSPNIESEDKEAKEVKVERNEEGCCHIDVSMWKEPKFLVICISASFIMFGHYAPQIHLVRYCEDIGITADAASRLFIYYGLASCLGRVVSGRLCDIEKVNNFYVYQLAEVVVGTGTLVISMATSYMDMVIYIVIYGFCDGAFITALNVLILNCVSPEKTPAALGWEMQVTSLFTASGPPIAGLVADSLNSYTHAFQMAGAVVFVGACIPFVLICIKDRDPKKKAAVQIIEL